MGEFHFFMAIKNFDRNQNGKSGCQILKRVRSSSRLKLVLTKFFNQYSIQNKQISAIHAQNYFVHG